MYKDWVVIIDGARHYKLVKYAFCTNSVSIGSSRCSEHIAIVFELLCLLLSEVVVLYGWWMCSWQTVKQKSGASAFTKIQTSTWKLIYYLSTDSDSIFQ